VGLLGRRLRAIVATGALLALAVSLASRADAASVVSGYAGVPDHVKGRLHTDGTLTIGGTETLSVTGLPGKFRLAALVEPAGETTDCFDFNEGFCLPQPLFHVAGTPRFHSSRKGRAALTFVMPPGVEFVNFANPLQSHPVNFVNGDRVLVYVQTTIRHRDRRGGAVSVSFPVAAAHVVVEVPAPPPSG
jgi:hypothetical protein